MLVTQYKGSVLPGKEKYPIYTTSLIEVLHAANSDSQIYTDHRIIAFLKPEVTPKDH